MSAAFFKIFNMSVTASWLIVAVVLARFLLQKAPKWVSCLLWALVAVRLICPFSFKSALSLVPSTETVNTTEYSARPYIQSGIDVIDDAANSYLGSHYYEGVTVAPRDSLSNPLNVISVIWMIGMAAMLLYALISYLKLRKNVSACVPAGKGIYACDDVRTPFILGVFRPRIYVPSDMAGETLENVIRHEKAHLARGDHWWKPLGFLLLAVYWFNPLCWIAYVLLCRDIELACDERVIRNMDEKSVAGYSQALLDCSLPTKAITACPLAFGEVGVKERVKDILNYRKPAFWIIIAAIVVCIAITVFLMTDPFRKSDLPKLIGNSSATAYDAPGAEWYYELNQRDKELLANCVSSAAILNADQLKERTKESAGASNELLILLGDKAGRGVPADGSQSERRLLTSYYEDIDLSVVADTSKGGTEADWTFYAAPGRAMKDLYLRWNLGAYSPEPYALRIECKSYGFTIEAHFKQKDRPDSRYEELRCGGNEFSTEILELISSKELNDLVVITLYAALHNFVVVAMSEEISKYLACRHVLKKDAPDASLLETVVYAIIAAMGFGFLESIVYAFTTNVMQMIVRGVTMMHGTFAFTVGRFMVKDRKSGQKAYTWLGLAISTFLHGLYDFCLDEKLNEMNEWTGAVSLLLAVVSLVQVFLILRYVRRKRDLEEYVAPFHCG